MLGRDQSVNLSGMLGQIAETTGEMGDAYKPVLKESTKPRGDMNDPRIWSVWLSGPPLTAIVRRRLCT